MVCWRSVTQSWEENILKSLSSVSNHEAAPKKVYISSSISFKSLQRCPEKAAVRNRCRLTEVLSLQEDFLKGNLVETTQVWPKLSPKAETKSPKTGLDLDLTAKSAQISEESRQDWPRHRAAHRCPCQQGKMGCSSQEFTLHSIRVRKIR